MRKLFNNSQEFSANSFANLHPSLASFSHFSLTQKHRVNCIMGDAPLAQHREGGQRGKACADANLESLP